MPMIGLGTMMLKDKDFIVKAVVDGEYRHIDTAQCYENENIGTYFNNFPLAFIFTQLY